MRTDSLELLDSQVVGCRLCPRLVEFREAVAAEAPPAHAGEPYWSRPLPGFGDPFARIVVVGLAPAAHGSNRTGRMFTGDRSGDFLFAGLHRAGLASLPTSERADDGQVLTGVRLTAPVRCVPPANRPTADERSRCGQYLARELALVQPAVVVALGGFGWEALCRTLAEQGWQVPRPWPRFAHGAEVRLVRQGLGDDGDGQAAGQELTLLGCFHPSPHNTYTGRLTPAMLDAVLARAQELGHLPG